ncbi:MAG: hypothetical protein QOE33_2545 [Acidobacteriota bacterium]|nr:hypothetical protein [Acidobacteriota bacterium]
MPRVLQEQFSEVRLYSIAGRTLSLSTAEEWSTRLVESFLGGFYYRKLDDAHADITCPIRILRGHPPAIPTGFRSFEMEQGAFYTNGEEYHLVFDDSRVVVSGPARPRVDIWIGDGPVARHPVALVNVMSAALQFALHRCGLSQLHAAGVVEPASGAGLLIVGDSNSGKSSLTVRLARAGWSYLSDDLLLLHEHETNIAARALRRTFSVSAGSIAGCELPRLEEALGSPVNSDPEKRRLDPTVVFPGGFVESCQPKVVIFPRIAHEERTRIEGLTMSDALLRFLKVSPWASFDADGSSYLRLIERLVRQTRAYIVHAGRDLLDDVTLAPRLFADLIND